MPRMNYPSAFEKHCSLVGWSDGDQGRPYNPPTSWECGANESHDDIYLHAWLDGSRFHNRVEGEAVPA